MRTNSTHFYCKHAFALLLCFFVSISTMFAVPAWSGWQTKSQPDGTTIVVRQLGDEFYSYWETQDGKLAIQQADGTFVVSDAPVPTPAQVSVRRQSSPMYDRHLRKAAAKALTPPRGLAILVQFKDEKFQDGNDNHGFHDMLNKKDYSYNGATGSARDYFIAQSDSLYKPDFDVFGPVTLPNSVIYYGEHGDVDVIGTDGNPTGEKKDANDKYMADFVVDAVLAADEAGCDFSKYDSDGDGTVDIIYFFYAGKSEAEGGASKTIWPHSWNLAAALFQRRTHGTTSYDAYNLPELDGKTILNYVCSSELSKEGVRNGIGTFCHEFGHVLGLPDYYDTKYGYNSVNERTPGCWSIMDAGSYNNESRTPPNYSIYDKYFLGWATPKFLQKDADLNIEMTTGYDDAYQMYGGSELVDWSYAGGKVYYVENRQQTGWDTYLPGHGMLIWEVDYNAEYWDQNVLNCLGGKPKYTVYSAFRHGDELDDLVRIGFDTDPFPGSKDRHDFKVVSGCELTEINEGSGNITFKLNNGGVCRNVVTDITGCKFSTISCAAENVPLYVTFIPESEYDDITSLTVQVGSTTLTKGTDYVLSEDHKTLTIYPAAIKAHSGDISVTAKWEKVIMAYRFPSDIVNCTYPSDGTCRRGENLVLKITPNGGYTLNGTGLWSVLHDALPRQYEFNYGEQYSYNETTNELTIYSVPCDLYIKPMPRALERWYADGELFEENKIYGTTIHFPSPAPGNCSNGRQFVGWCKVSDYHHLTVAPTFVDDDESRDEDKPASYYAIYAQSGAPKDVSATGYINYSTKCNEAPAYIVTFLDEDATLIGTHQVVEQGQAAIAPTKPKDCYKLTWDKDFSNVTEDMTVTAVWVSQKTFDWHIEPDDNAKGEVIFNPEPKCTDLTLTFRAQAKDGYQFMQWSDGVKDAQRTITLTKDTVITARFAKLWKITWLDEDGKTELDVSWVPNGEIPVYKDGVEKPTKAPTELYTYTFATWLPTNPKEATADATYTAYYNEEFRRYTVTFMDGDQNLGTRQTTYGGSVVPPSPSKTCYNYSWDKELTNITEDMVVNIIWSLKPFDRTYSAVSEDESKGTVDTIQEPTCLDNTFIVRAVAKPGYAFKRWSDGHDDNPYSVTVNSNTALVAKWVKTYTITWKDHDGSILDTNEVPEGQWPEFSLPTPTREPDAQHTYSFKGWTPSVEAAYDNAVYTAEYYESTRYYTVIFQYEDGTEIKKYDVTYGATSVTAPSSYDGFVVPDCHKVTWDKDFSYITSDLVVTAIIDEIKVPKWEIKNDDPTQGEVKILQEPTCKSPYLQLEAMAIGDGEFSRWSTGSTYYKLFLTLTQDTVITVYWKKYYTITWKNGDEVLEIDYNVPDGTKPTYDGTTPTKAADEGYTYKFKGWDPEVEPAKSDQVYTATFTPKPKEFFVTFVGLDGWQVGELQMVKYGEPAIEPTYDPVITEDCKTWKWDTDFSSIKENVQIHAVYVDKPLPYTYSIVSSNTDQGTVQILDKPTSCWAVMKFEATPNAGYEFLKWSDGDKENPRYLQVTQDTTITALWEKTATVWTITWMNGDQLLATSYVPDGEKPEYKGATPTKAADAEFTYTFSGWTPEVVPATANATYTATFDKTLNKYTVTFMNGDKMEKEELVEYGSSATPPEIEIPDCKLLSWKPDYSNITGNLTVYAQWSDKPLGFTWSATSADEKMGKVLITHEPTCSDPKLTAYAMATSGYKFDKWSDGETKNPYSLTVDKNIALIAQWIPTWTIVWKNGDVVLETDNNVPNGTTPTYDGAEPTKAADAEFTYTFSGWTPEVVPATANATYTATFDKTLNKYTVTFMNGDKMEKEELVEYGSSATPPEIEIPDCKLLSWKPDYSNITGNLTVYAQWSDKPLEFTWSATSADEKMGKVDINKTPTCSDPELIALATANDGYEFVKWSDGATENPHTVTVDKNIALVAQFKAIEVVPIEITVDTDLKDIVTDASTDIEVTSEVVLTVSTPTTIHSITLEYSESGHAQLSGITNLTVDEIEVKMQFPTPIGPLDEQWFAIAVPFAVSMATGIRYEGSDKPAIPGTDFIVEEYDGAMRATTQRGWKSVKADATLYPGRMYMISMSSHATWYLKAADPKTLSEPTSVGISAYDSKIGAHHSGWNGIANTLFTCASGDAAGISYATTFNNKKGVYEAQATGSYVFGAAVPFFVQTAAGGVLNFTDESGTPAPLRAQYAQSSSIAAVTLSDGNYTDKAFWTVNADKQDVYTIGSDLQKMQVANAGVPQISILAYNMKLSAYEAPFTDNATIPVSLYAPAEGTYSIAVSNVPDDLNVLLMKNGNLVWDITSSSFAADLQAGDNAGYSLYVHRIKEMGTGVNNNGNETHNVQKVLFNDRIYIIRDGKTYVITGECVNQ